MCAYKVEKYCQFLEYKSLFKGFLSEDFHPWSSTEGLVTNSFAGLTSLERLSYDFISTYVLKNYHGPQRKKTCLMVCY